MMALLSQLPTDPNAFIGFASLLADVSGPTLFIIFIIALVKGWIVLPRELVAKDRRIVELNAERDEYKQMAFRALNVGERVTAAVEERNRT